MHERAWQGLAAALGLAGIMVVACNDGGGLSAQDAPTVIANAACDWFYSCNCANLDDARFSSIEDCRLEVAGEVQDGIDEGEAAGLSFSSECAQRVVDLIDTLGCATLGELILDPRKLGAALEIQDCKLYYGERGAGQHCTALEHSNGDDCVPEYACIDGVCQVVANDLRPGDSCMPQDSRCATGLVCLDINGGTDPKCETLPSVGETCKGTLDLCEVQYYCEQSSKTCTRLPSVGQACAPFPNYLQMRCDFGAVCVNETCEAAPGGGEPCLVTCAEGFSCENGVCVESPALACAYVPFV